MWSLIVATSSGVYVVCCGDAVGWVKLLIYRFWGCEGLVCGAVSVEYDAGACSKMFVWVMCACHIGW